MIMTRREHPYQVIGGPAIEAEADHFLHCPRCGAWIDCWRLGELFDHEDWCAHGGTRAKSLVDRFNEAARLRIAERPWIDERSRVAYRGGDPFTKIFWKPEARGLQHGDKGRRHSDGVRDVLRREPWTGFGVAGRGI